MLINIITVIIIIIIIIIFIVIITIVPVVFCLVYCNRHKICHWYVLNDAPLGSATQTKYLGVIITNFRTIMSLKLRKEPTKYSAYWDVTYLLWSLSERSSLHWSSTTSPRIRMRCVGSLHRQTHQRNLKGATTSCAICPIRLPHLRTWIHYKNVWETLLEIITTTQANWQAELI